MQADLRNSQEKCRCCLAEGPHRYHYDPEMLKMCLNLILISDSRITMMVCEACLSFICEVERFRKIVMSSQKQLLASVCHNGPAQIYIQNDLADDGYDDIVKTEDEDKIDTSLESLGETNEKEDTDHREENYVKLKKEIESNSEELSDYGGFENRDTDTNIKSEVKISKAKVKRKRKAKNDRTDTAKKNRQSSEDSESDTPIAKIKEKKTRLKNKTNTENITETKTLVSRKHTFVDNSKLRSNIIMILKNSTVLPFRNNFKSIFQCFYCDDSYIPFKELKEHIEKEHSNISEITICKKVRSLSNIMVSADISCLKCKICDEEFKTIDNLTEHLSKIHNKIYHETEKKPSHGILGVDLSTDTLKCHICHQDFAYFKNLSIHMNEHYGSFVCDVCGKKFLSEHRYRCHEFKAHANKETKCKHCGLVFKTEPSMVYHIRKEHLNRRIKCLKCPETFALGQYIKRMNHMAEVHGIKKPKFKCDACGKEYGNSGSLAAHKRYTHKRIRELRCDICGYITVHNTVMKKHMDFHNGIRNYECEFCKKRFGKPYTLKLHMKTHLNDKKFACTLCDAAFIQKNSLKSHLKSRHPDCGIDISKL